MIEAKKRKKMYRPKKGPSVQALKGVSLKLEDKGLVFILGKSGSGKSTLLNVMGGLDSYDEGEIIIKNKSSKDFTQSEFDSYRNTFIGFIFQEYNILNEFTVGQNIALAIELQGKKATSEEVNSILDEVDLTDYANRKPNELSGGQKQRVAIARALIKKPEIIMADEPTGALDSNTGKMIFDTLKKLSETKLVVVVSHDRDFAEQFGDRVIELADGEIVSDIYKHTITPDSKSIGVSVVDEKLIHIKKGYSLTAEDLKLIYDYIKKNEQDTYISLDSKTNDEVKRIARITDDGNREAFLETSDEELTMKDYNPEDCKFIKSRLPYKKALKIGASGLKTKPFRLFMTIILSAVAFCLFGIAMTAADYDKKTLRVCRWLTKK
jgi:ABC-type antimicrobial peptide transport system, ATPase component